MESTGVNDVDFDAVDEKVAIYDLSGNSKENIANGINIIVYKSGKIVKLLKKQNWVKKQQVGDLRAHFGKIHLESAAMPLV